MNKKISGFRFSSRRMLRTFSGLFCVVGIGFLSFLFHNEALQVNAGTQTPTPTPLNSGVTSEEAPVFDLEPTYPTPEWGNLIYPVPLALTPHDHFYFNRPLLLSKSSRLNAEYRYGYYYPEEDVVHTGIDIIGIRGDPVLAAASGKVIFTGNGLLNGANHPDDPYGLSVMIRHSFSYNGYTIYSVYAHLDKINVNKGDWVESGQKIGTVGMTGNTSGPHLHFEIRIENSLGDKVQNPELWLSPPVGNGVLAGRIETSYGMMMTTKTLWLKSVETGKTWTIITYAPKTKQLDDFYNENFAIGEIPSGNYEISIYYYGKLYKKEIFISPAAVNYIQFHGSDGFSTELPENTDGLNFLTPHQ
jgi:hypothetical protein